MKKIILGSVIGSILSFSLSAYATNIQNLIGKSVDGQFPVSIDGQTLSIQAPVIEGTSYLPVRAIAESLNMDVSFDSNIGIRLSQKGDTKMSSNPVSKTVPKVRNNSGTREVGYYSFVEIDGNQYLSAVPLLGEYDIAMDGDVVVFKKEGQSDIRIPKQSDYSSGTDSFMIDGLTVIKLSILGLKASIQGDTLIIEKQ